MTDVESFGSTIHILEEQSKNCKVGLRILCADFEI